MMNVEPARVQLWRGGRLSIWCPGCGQGHQIGIDGPDAWTWDGNRVRPTISPSILSWPNRKLIDPDLEGDALTAPENVTSTPRCHSFVRDGRIEFLPDSTHALAGQTVDLPPWPVERFASQIKEES